MDEQPSDFAIARVDVVGPFDLRKTGQEVAGYQIENREGYRLVELKLEVYGQEFRVQDDAEADVFAGFAFPFATNLPPAIMLVRGRNNSSFGWFAFCKQGTGVFIGGSHLWQIVKNLADEQGLKFLQRKRLCTFILSRARFWPFENCFWFLAISFWPKALSPLQHSPLCNWVSSGGFPINPLQSSSF